MNRGLTAATVLRLATLLALSGCAIQHHPRLPVVAVADGDAHADPHLYRLVT